MSEDDLTWCSFYLLLCVCVWGGGTKLSMYIQFWKGEENFLVLEFYEGTVVLAASGHLLNSVEKQL